MKKYPYFKNPGPCLDGSPAPVPLSFSIRRTVRFEEVDPLRIMWHGRYPSYFEDARVAFGEKYGIGYHDLYREQIAAPLKSMHIDYAAPLHFGESCCVSATLHWSEAARINFSYTIHNEREQLATTGYTVQLFLTRDGELCMEQPEFYAAFCHQWKSGALH